MTVSSSKGVWRIFKFFTWRNMVNRNTGGFIKLSVGNGKLVETVGRKVNRRKAGCFCIWLEQEKISHLSLTWTKPEYLQGWQKESAAGYLQYNLSQKIRKIPPNLCRLRKLPQLRVTKPQKANHFCLELQYFGLWNWWWSQSIQKHCMDLETTKIWIWM